MRFCFAVCPINFGSFCKLLMLTNTALISSCLLMFLPLSSASIDYDWSAHSSEIDDRYSAEHNIDRSPLPTDQSGSHNGNWNHGSRKSHLIYTQYTDLVTFQFVNFSLQCSLVLAATTIHHSSPQTCPKLRALFPRIMSYYSVLIEKTVGILTNFDQLLYVWC